MSFLKLILKNPFRKKSRAILSILGIMIGIIVIIALGSISAGLVQSMSNENDENFFIMNNTVENYGTPSNLNTESIGNISSIDGIEDTTEYVQGTVMDGTTYLSISGLDKNKLNVMDIGITEGKVYSNNDEIIIGKLLSDSDNKTIGDTINIKDKDYTITGIFETGDSQGDRGIMMNLNESREVCGIGDNEIFLEQVKIKPGADIEQVKSEVDNATPEEVKALSDASELDSVKSLMNIVDGATVVISALAIIIGGLGVINTMLMSVFDRTKEIGLLKAIGWSKKRIITMILSESMILTITAFIFGSIISIIGLSILSQTGLFTPAFPPKIFITAFIVSLVVGLVGGFYPAYRASRFEATEALRYE